MLLSVLNKKCGCIWAFSNCSWASTFSFCNCRLRCSFTYQCFINLMEAAIPPMVIPPRKPAISDRCIRAVARNRKEFSWAGWCRNHCSISGIIVADKIVDITAAPRKQMSTQMAVSQYFCLSRNRGITKYRRAYARAIWRDHVKKSRFCYGVSQAQRIGGFARIANYGIQHPCVNHQNIQNAKCRRNAVLAFIRKDKRIFFRWVAYT